MAGIMKRKERKMAERLKRKKEIIQFALETNQDFFTVMLITYLLLLLLEELKEGFVSYYLNLNIILGIVIASGIITVLGSEDKLEKKPEGLTAKDYIWIFVLGVIGAALIFYKTKDLGNLSYIISIISGTLIILLSILLLSEENSSSDANS